MPLNRAVLVLTLLISSYGLPEDNEGDASCNADQNGKSMLQAGRDFKKHDTLKVGQIPTEAIQGKTCNFENTDTGLPAQIIGEVPQGDGPWPLAVYLQGTYASWGNGVAVAFHEQMAQRKFYSISIQYSNMKYQNGGNCAMFKEKASNVAGCIDQLCTEKNIDCSLGLAMYGWSQGGQVSSLVGNYTTFPVTAWLGFSSTYLNYGPVGPVAQHECLSPLKVPQHKRRLIMGDVDGLMGGNGSAASGNVTVIIDGARKVTDPPSCTTPYDCIQEDGSGYYVATTAETGLVMYHWWFIGATASGMGLQAAFVNPPSPSVEWGEKTLFDWLASTALDGR